MPAPDPCEARQEGDVWICHRCKLAWDADDPDPPQCPLRQAREPVDVAEELRKLHALVDRHACELRAEINDIFNAGREFERALLQRVDE